MSTRARKKSSEFYRDDTDRNALLILGAMVLMLVVGIGLIVAGLR